MMRTREIGGETVGRLPIEQTRQGALSEAIAALSESEQFTLVFIRSGDEDPEIVGFGGVDPAIVSGLKVAYQYLSEELQALNQLSDVNQLVDLLQGRSLEG